jgi:hypothetical protein
MASRRLSRFEKGVPADPTKNMSPEDAAEWEEMTEKYKDKFKKAYLDIRPASKNINVKTAARNWWEWGETHVWEFIPTNGIRTDWEGTFESLKTHLKKNTWDGHVLVKGPGHGTWTQIGRPSNIVNRVPVTSDIQRRFLERPRGSINKPDNK